MNRILLKLLISFWKVVLLFPRAVHKKLGLILGYLFYKSNLKRNKFSKKNIDLCLKRLDKEEKEKVYKSNILLSGTIPFDTGVAWFWSDKRINKHISYKIIGLEKLIEEQNNNNGVLLFFKHSLHLELDARLLGMNADVFGVERVHNSNSFDSIQNSGRLKSLKGACDRNNPLKFIRWLKKGKTVLYATDQDYGISQSDIINFFGNPAATISAPLKIIKSTLCKTYFLNSFIKNDKYILEIEEINCDSSSEINFSTDLNNYMADKIQAHPHEYLWQHRRFKSTFGKDKFYE